MGAQYSGKEEAVSAAGGLSRFRDSLAQGIMRPLQPVVARLGLTPNVLTLIGFGLSLVTAAVIGSRHFVLGGILVLVAGLFDLLDGAAARASRRVTVFGGLLDSTMDRLSEAAMLFGLLLAYSPWSNSKVEVWLIYLALVGSFMVSYIRARAEGLGLHCKVGVLTRAERVVILALGLLLGQVLIALGILVALTFATVLHRLLFVRAEAHPRERLAREGEET